MSEAPERIWAVPEYNCTVYMSGNSPITAQTGPFEHHRHGKAVEYVRADLSDALLREAMESLGCVIAACDQGRMVATTGVSGMTIEANIRGSVYMGVPAWPIEEARDTLAKLRAHLGEKE